MARVNDGPPSPSVTTDPGAWRTALGPDAGPRLVVADQQDVQRRAVGVGTAGLGGGDGVDLRQPDVSICVSPDVKGW
jgi:hypothetical protein